MKICLSIQKHDSEFQDMVADLERYAQVDVVGLSGFSLSGYDIFIGKKLSSSALKTADRLKIAFAYKTGVEDFPLRKLEEKGILLVNSHADAAIIAEYAFGLSISLVNRITECDKKLRNGIWYDNANPYWKSIFNMKVGLLGYGHIGKQIHRILKQNHIATYTLDRGRQYQDIEALGTVEELFLKTDLIIMSLPNTKDTDGMVNRNNLPLLENKYLVNVGRSNSIVQEDLYYALKNRLIAGAAIDTWDKKPKNNELPFNPSEFPFEDLDNVVLSPHQAMRVEVGHKQYVSDITKKVIRYLKTGEITDQVDLKKGY